MFRQKWWSKTFKTV